MSRFADYAMEQGGEWKKHFVLEPTANRAMTAAKKADSDAAWDELTTSFSLGADPNEAIKTIGFLKQDVKRQGNIGSLHSRSSNKKLLNCLG